MPDIHRIAIYARVRTKNKGQDPENQLQKLREFAKAQGWEIVREYVDRVAGKTPERTQFKKLSQGASRRQFGVSLRTG
jgi:DNA invertase Pin-like site-specific DNA recombinase